MVSTIRIFLTYFLDNFVSNWAHSFRPVSKLFGPAFNLHKTYKARNQKSAEIWKGDDGGLWDIQTFLFRFSEFRKLLRA